MHIFLGMVLNLVSLLDLDVLPLAGESLGTRSMAVVIKGKKLNL